MKNEDAIKLIQEIGEDGRNVSSQHIEALNLAIKALEEVEEWHKLKLICANEGIMVYKTRGEE